jgi:hypothetical protein
MKKTATLLAGLLLVTGTVFAGEWTVSSATVEGTLNVIDTQYGALSTDAGDLNFTVKSEKEGDFGKLTAELGLDKKSEDNSFKLTYMKTEGDFTVATSAKLITTSKTANSGNWALETQEGSDSYIKWNVMGSETVSATYYPWEVDGMSWDNDTWESFTGYGNPGLAVAVKLSDSTDFTTKLSVANGDSTTKNKYAVKGEFNTKMDSVTVNAYGAYATNDKQMAMGAKASMTLSDALTVNGEFNTSKKDKDDAFVGMFAKVSSKLEDMNGYTPTAYASVKYLNKDAANSDEGDSNGALTELEGGLALAQGSFTITPKVVLTSREEKDFGKEDSTDMSKTRTKLGVNFKYSM